VNLESRKIRNIGLVGHSGAGKTSLSEAMLFSANVINRMGTIQDKNTVSDYHTDETERQMSIHSTLLSFEHDKTSFNIIDMPGYADFMGDVKGSMRVCDMSLFLINAVDGLQIGTERAWKYADEFKHPRMICINGLDRKNSDFDTQLNTMRNRWGTHVVPLQLPIGQGASFCSVIDLIRNKVLTWKQHSKGGWAESDIPEDLLNITATYRQELIDTIAESDDNLLEKYLEEGDLSEDDIQEGLINAVSNQNIFPIVCSSATQNVGTTRIMQLLTLCAPSPDTITISASINGEEHKIGVDSPTSAFIFKTMAEQHIGELSFFRVYSGTVHSGGELKNDARSVSERFNQLFIMAGKNRTNVSELPTGAIAAVVKLKNTHTCDTLSEAKYPITIPPTKFQTPCISFAMTTASKGDEDKFGRALAAIHEEDPTFHYEVSAETTQTIVSGMGEIHILAAMERMKERYKLDIAVTKPKVPYRETIHVFGASKYRHKKQTGGSGQFAEVWVKIEPLECGSGIEFMESLVGQNVDRGFVSSVEKGIHQICNTGIIIGCKIVDIKVNFYDGKMHPVDSNDMAFQIAGREAFKEAFKEAEPYLLEPIYEIEVYVPNKYMGDIISDISSRRGQVLGMDSDGHFQIIKAKIPLANLFKYSTVLRSLTQGTAEHTEKFSHYEEMPSNISLKAIEEYSESKKNSEKCLTSASH